jgi:LAO/AO transport system kinase
LTESLVDRLLRGEPAALARAITAVETESEKGREILRAVQPRLGQARLVGFTGPPGAGKSTLVGAYIGELLKGGKSVGVIAVDPSSPISGGAILGDRLRMTEHAGDPAVFIRSLASRGHLGGLSPAASRIADLMDAAGKDVVILETVGAGQSEVEVAEVADVAVVVCAPGLGDDVQAIKAGILEIADVLVVNKADLPLADRTRRQLKAMLQLRASHGDVPVLSTTATSGAGVAELAAAIEAVWAAKGRPPPGTRLKRIIAEAAVREVRARILESPLLAAVAAAVERGELDVAGAASELVRALGET